MNREKIKLATNVPCVMELESNAGKESTSRFHDGVEYMYSGLVDGKPSIMYLPVDGKLAISRSGAKAGDTIELLKTRQSNRDVFQVRIVIPESAPVRMLAPRASAPLPPTHPYSHGAAALAPSEELAPQDGFNTKLAKRCFTAAIDVLMHAKEYGANRYQLALEFNEEDVRALGISFLIGERDAK